MHFKQSYWKKLVRGAINVCIKGVLYQMSILLSSMASKTQKIPWDVRSAKCGKSRKVWRKVLVWTGRAYTKRKRKSLTQSYDKNLYTHRFIFTLSLFASACFGKFGYHFSTFNPLAALNAFEKLDVTARNNVIDWRHLRAFPLTSYLRRILMYFNGV